jgi:hypothetical protein
VVLAEVAVDVAGEHQVDHGAAWAELADLQSAVVDELLGGLRRHREHRIVDVGLANNYGHGENRAGDGVLRLGHAVTVIRSHRNVEGEK